MIGCGIPAEPQLVRKALRVSAAPCSEYICPVPQHLPMVPQDAFLAPSLPYSGHLSDSSLSPLFQGFSPCCLIQLKVAASFALSSSKKPPEALELVPSLQAGPGLLQPEEAQPPALLWPQPLAYLDGSSQPWLHTTQGAPGNADFGAPSRGSGLIALM